MCFPRPRDVVVLLLGSCFLFGTSGCITASILTLGSVLGALGSAASTGSSVYKLGKLDTAVMASYDDTRSAVRAAASDLRLKACVDGPQDHLKTFWFIALCDRKHTETDVIIERRAQELCRLRVDVGIFGDEPTARLVMHRIHVHLPGGLAEHPD